MTLDLEALKELAGKSTLNWVEAEKVILAVPALIAEVERLREALGRTKEAILSDVNGLSIQCTIWMPGAGVPPHETLVDFIDAALSPTPPADKEG